jgi:hypothetical protein
MNHNSDPHYHGPGRAALEASFVAPSTVHMDANYLGNLILLA